MYAPREAARKVFSRFKVGSVSNLKVKRMNAILL